MAPIRCIVVGSGWRSLFYWRIARAYPELFEMAAMVCRTEEKASRMSREYGIPAVFSEKAGEERQPEFVVVAVNKAAIFEVTKRWALKGYPVLCETPAALTLENVRELWRLRQEAGVRIQTAEQYFLYPSFCAGIEAVKRGYLGDPYAIDISAAHDYHAVSLIRRYLNIGYQNMIISGKRYHFPVEETDSRYGAITDGRVSQRERVRLTFEFEGGKTAFYDFDGIQYHSFIRSRHIKVQGQLGELDDGTLRYVDKEHKPHRENMQTEYGDQGGISRIRLGGQLLYENPFIKRGQQILPSQDETAIAEFLFGMREYISKGIEVYPLAEALQDAYVRVLMEEMLETGQAVRSERQEWAEN